MQNLHEVVVAIVAFIVLIGVMVVTLFVGLDIFLQRAPRPRMALTAAVAR